MIFKVELRAFLLWNKEWIIATVNSPVNGTLGEEIVHDNCDAFESVILDEQTLSKVNPFLFPLAIEFALTGAIFFHHMFKKVGERWLYFDPEKIACSINSSIMT